MSPIALKPSSNVLSSVALLLVHPEPHNTNPESPSCAARISAADHVTTEDSVLAVDALATMLLEPVTGIILTTIKAAIRTDNILLVLFLMRKIPPYIFHNSVIRVTPHITNSQ